MTCPLVPCATCPWRRSNPPGGAAIPGFDLDLMRSLSATVGEGDAFRVIMACHHSTDTDEFPCVGYLAVEGWSNLSVRVGALQGKWNLPAIVEAGEQLDLWASFAAMLAAYEAASATPT